MTDQWGPLTCAIEVHDSVAVEILLAERTIDVNSEDPASGSLPLQHTIDLAIDGYVQSMTPPRFDIVRMLVAAGADPHRRDGDGDSASDLARKSENAELVSILAGATGASDLDTSHL